MTGGIANMEGRVAVRDRRSAHPIRRDGTVMTLPCGWTGEYKGDRRPDSVCLWLTQDTRPTKISSSFDITTRSLRHGLYWRQSPSEA